MSESEMIKLEQEEPEEKETKIGTLISTEKSEVALKNNEAIFEIYGRVLAEKPNLEQQIETEEKTTTQETILAVQLAQNAIFEIQEQVLTETVKYEQQEMEENPTKETEKTEVALKNNQADFQIHEIALAGTLKHEHQDTEKKQTEERTPISAEKVEVALKDNEPIFQLYEKVLAFHGAVLYDAKVMARKILRSTSPETEDDSFTYFLHFLQWSKRYDEWIPEQFVLKHTPENVEIQKNLDAAAKATTARSNGKSMSTSSKKRKRSKSSNNARPMGDVENGNNRSTEVTILTPTNESNDFPGLETNLINQRMMRTLQRSVESETVFKAAPRVLIPIPEILKQVLFDDWVLVVQKNQLLDLPAHPNLEKILEDYFLSRGDIAGSPEDIFTSNIENAFNEAIQYLIYEAEAIQFQFVAKCHDDIVEQLAVNQELPTMSSVYGLVHLLRLISKMGDRVAHSNFNAEDTNRMLHHMTDFLQFLQENVEKYFDPKQYTLSPEDYHSILGTRAESQPTELTQSFAVLQ